MNSDNSKTSDPHRLLLNLTDEINLKRSDKYVVLSNLSIYHTWRNIEKSYKNNKYQLQHGMKSLNYLVDHILYQIFKITLNTSLKKKHGKGTDNPSIRIYVNKIGNRITFKIKAVYYLELLILKTMKLLGTTKSKIKKDKNGKNVPHLEITELVLIHCNIVNNDYQQNSRVLYTFVLNKLFG